MAQSKTGHMNGFRSFCGREFCNRRHLYLYFYSHMVSCIRSAEFTSGIIASCLPATPTFFRHFFNRVLRKFSTSNIQNRKGLWKSTTTYISKSTSQWPSRHLHSWGLPSVTELLERSIWDKYDIENARIWNGTQACPPGSYCLTTEVTAEAVGKGGGGGSGSKTDEFEDLEGILKTVELDIESQYGQDG